jgi:nicotinate dehydrogenase subunit A
VRQVSYVTRLLEPENELRTHRIGVQSLPFFESPKAMPAKTISLHVNGQVKRVTVDDPDMPLLYALRDNLGLHGPRFGCGLGQCGACTVHIDGSAVHSCVTPLSAVGKKKVVTLEGLGGSSGKLVAIQEAFITEQAAQCGFCINGMIMEAAAFLAHNRTPSEAQIKQALAHNLCRCGTHLRIVRAVKRASVSA